MPTFPANEPSFLLPGPVGDLEVVAMPPNPESPGRSATAIICHPHPLFGGTMTNKVVSTLARTFSDLGLATVRFNFRGVGKSTGTFADGIGEIDDLLAVVEWVKQASPQHEIWLAGFSFGAAVSAHVATRIPVSQLVSIAPPVPRFGLLDLPPVTCPWIVVQGETDDVVQPEAVFNWVATRNPEPQLIRMAGAGHFFHGRLLELRELLVEALSAD
jgi:alpha/beta superfamily hydrolase